MVRIVKGKVTLSKRPASTRRTLIDRYNILRRMMVQAGVHDVPPKISSGRRKWLSGAYGALICKARLELQEEL